MNTELQGGRVKKVLKLIFVGDMGTGKTSFIRQFVSGVFSEFYKSTIGVDFAHKSIDWDENTTIDLQLWDISGQERFEKLTRMFYRESVGAYIFFDVNKLMTLDTAKFWKQDIDEKVFTNKNEPIPCVLLGNKCDLVKSYEWGKTKEEMDQYCKENKYIGFFETSAAERINVDESINFIVKYILDNGIEPYMPDVSNCVPCQETEQKPRGKNSCCK